MNAITKQQARSSMRIVYKLISAFYSCQYDESKHIITIHFVGYDIVVKVKSVQS